MFRYYTIPFILSIALSFSIGKNYQYANTLLNEDRGRLNILILPGLMRSYPRKISSSRRKSGMRLNGI